MKPAIQDRQQQMMHRQNIPMLLAEYANRCKMAMTDPQGRADDCSANSRPARLFLPSFHSSDATDWPTV